MNLVGRVIGLNPASDKNWLQIYSINGLYEYYE